MNAYTASGSRVKIGPELARGGEAVVYRLVGRGDQVAKIYSKPRPDYHDKMRHMRVTPPSDPTLSLGHASIAWPRDLLYDREKRFVGYVMPFIDQAVPIVSVFNPRRRATVLPGFDNAYLHRAARNLSSALAALHRRGYVIGDMNERNVLVTPRALVTLIDTDSFQVQHPTASTIVVYPCPVGRSEYTPPELQGRAFREVLRSSEHDCFGLGVLVFQLLMSGSHPFRGQWSGSGDPPPIEQRIKQGWFPYSTGAPKDLAPPNGGPRLEHLHGEIGDLFMRCFFDGHLTPARRPNAVEWARGLAEAERHLVVCKNDHSFADHLRKCPVCDAGRKWGRGKQAPITKEQAAPEPSVTGAVSASGAGAAAATVPAGASTGAALARVGHGVAAPFVATGRAVSRARASMARSYAAAQLGLSRLPGRVAMGALFHASRPRATAEALRYGSRRLVRHAGLAVAAAGAGIGIVALLEAGGVLDAWIASSTVAPGAISLAVGGLAMLMVGTFRGLAEAPSGHVTAPLIQRSLTHAGAGVVGAAAGWLLVSLLLGIVSGDSLSQLYVAAGAPSQALPARTLGWVLGWTIYGAVAGSFGAAIRPSSGGWATSGFVFGAAGSVALRLGALLLQL